ncbi:ClbS/DfsB family four-helix bundle protein [Irregularibacter muris]|uniref:ClbS/DfsB family four-helix bundle protein n=1 Tax=Irregularibacter muris TaxID=1796619 RepID=A0AAE3HE79_9FIRM|nr:ClbS/DfsB family four-helix bundle protein [Irregularibacter muris]MCR1897478.1 ClbS/DfsB family four-helix bundle protein [Irregularibacter muris]
MPRPATKTDLILVANQQFDKMWTLIDSMTMEEFNSSFHFGDDPKDKEAHWKRDKNLRDILVHLYEWHQLLIHWIVSNQSGHEVSFLPKPYNWRTYSDMNREFWAKHQNTLYEDAKRMLLKSHKEVLELIESFSNEALFEKQHFKWSGTTNIGSYCVSATSSHYNWAIKKIKRQIKKLRSHA